MGGRERVCVCVFRCLWKPEKWNTPRTGDIRCFGSPEYWLSTRKKYDLNHSDISPAFDREILCLFLKISPDLFPKLSHYFALPPTMNKHALSVISVPEFVVTCVSHISHSYWGDLDVYCSFYLHFTVI